MLRTFNYTDRQKIPRANVTVRLFRYPVGSPTFDAKFNLADFSLPGDARVFVEAYHNASYMRFEYGVVSDIRSPSDRRLHEIDGDGTAQFRLKIVDGTVECGRVLAEASNIIPIDGDDESANRDSILPITYTELGHQLWRVSFDDGGDGRPVLQLNRNANNIRQRAAGDDEFFACVYPAVVREILQRVLIREEQADVDGPADDWRVQWLKFALTLPGVMLPPQPDPEDDEGSVSRQLGWIDDAVAAFCEKCEVLKRFNSRIPSDDEV
jgi:hypothetical protein